MNIHCGNNKENKAIDKKVVLRLKGMRNVLALSSADFQNLHDRS